MTEEQPKKLNIVLQRTEEMKEKDDEIARLNVELGKMQETNKALLNEQKQQFEKEMTKKANPKLIEGNTAPLNENATWDIADSDVDPKWIKGKTVNEAIMNLEAIAKTGNKDAANLLGQLTKKSLRDKPLDLTYKGKLISLIREPSKIDEYDSKTDIDRKNAKNEALLKDRTNWVQNN